MRNPSDTTTFFNMLDTHDGDVTKGEVLIDGEPVHHLSPEQIVTRGVTQVLEGRRILAELTVEENLMLGAHTNRKAAPRNLDRVYGLFPVLVERQKSIAGWGKRGSCFLREKRSSCAAATISPSTTSAAAES